MRNKPSDFVKSEMSYRCTVIIPVRKQPMPFSCGLQAVRHDAQFGYRKPYCLSHLSFSNAKQLAKASLVEEGWVAVGRPLG